MSSYEIDQIILSTVLALIAASYAIVSGWLMFKMPSRFVPFQNWLRSILFDVPKESLTESNRQHGIARIIVGFLLFLGGILQAIGIIAL